MATGNVFNALATYNMRTYQVSDIRNEYSQQNYIAFRIITVLGSFAIFAIYSVLISPNTETLVCMIVFLAFKSDEAFANVLYGIDQKASRMDYIGISQGLRGILSIAVFSAGLSFTQNLAVALLLMLTANLLMSILYDIPHSGRIDAIRPQLKCYMLIQLLRKCAPIVVALIAYALVATLARQYYGIVYGEEALGIYAAVATPCVIVQVLANYLYSPLLVPLASSWNAEHIKTAQGSQSLDRIEADAITTKSLKKNITPKFDDKSSAFSIMLARIFVAFFCVSTLCIGCAALAGPLFLEVMFGPSINDYSWMITPAVVAAALMAVNYFMTDLFTLMRRFRFALLVNIMALGICTITVAPLTQQFGMNGINITLLISFGIPIIVGAILLWRIVKKRESSS